MKNTKKIFLILIFISSTIYFLHSNEKIKQNNANSNTNVTNQKSSNTQQKPTKKSDIPKEHADFLIQLFTKEPQLAAAIKFSYINAVKILNVLKKENNHSKQNNQKTNVNESQKIELYKKKILDPVKSFFTLLRAPIVSFLMEPLVIRGTINDTILNNIKNKKLQTNKEDNIKNANEEITLQDIVTFIPKEKLPFACKFLLAPEKEAADFFYKEIKNSNDLIQSCKEFFKIFGEIKSILTPEIHKKANTLIREMLQKTKKTP